MSAAEKAETAARQTGRGMLYLVCGAGAGVFLVIVQFVLAAVVPEDWVIFKRCLFVINYPAYLFLESYRATHGGDPEAYLLTWFIVVPIYWIILGCLLGLAAFLVKSMRRGKDR